MAVRQHAWLVMFRNDALVAQHGRCAYCRVPLRARDATGDHVEPVICGGGISRQNIRAACRPCNLTKSAMGAQAFLRLIKNPQPGDSIHVWLAWSRRRIALATERACNRIMAAVA